MILFLVYFIVCVVLVICWCGGCFCGGGLADYLCFTIVLVLELLFMVVTLCIRRFGVSV